MDLEHRKKAINIARKDLNTVMELKVANLEGWMAERLIDGRQFSSALRTRRILSNPDDPDMKEEVLDWLVSLRRQYGYESIHVIDHQGRLLAQASDFTPLQDEEIASHFAAALAAPDVMVGPIHAWGESSRLHFTVMCPVRDLARPEVPARGAVLMTIDPEKFVFPLLRKWNSSGGSAETVLVREEAGEVVYLGGGRLHSYLSLSLRLPLEETALSTGRINQSRSGEMVVGRDFRKREVFALAKAVPGMRWVLVAKVDAAEILEPVIQETWDSVIQVILLLALVGLIGRGVWQSQARDFARRESAEFVRTEGVRLAALQRTQLAVEATNVGIWEWHVSSQTMQWNEQMFRIYGVEPTGDLKMTYDQWRELVLPEDLVAREESLKRTRNCGCIGRCEFRIRRAADGEIRTLESVQLSRQAGGVTEWIIGTSLDVTERVQSKLALADSADRARMATEVTGVGVWEWNIITGEVNWDDQLFRIYGIEPRTDGKCSYAEWRSMVHSEDLAEQEHALQQTLETGLSSRRQFRIRRADDGEIRIIEGVETVRRNHQGEPEWMVGCNVDITDRKALEAEREDALRRIRLSTEATGVGLWEWNVKTGELKWDEASDRIYGFERMPGEELSLDKWSAAVLEEDREEQLRLVNGYFATKQGGSREFRIRRVSDGEIRFIEAVDAVRLDEKGEVEWLVGSNLDVTERRLSEQRIRQLSTVVEQSPVQIVITDLDGNIEYTNPHFSKTTGYSFDEVKGRNPRILQSGNTARELYDDLWDTISGGGTWHGLLHNRKKNGELFWEETVITPMVDGHDRASHFLAVKTDVTRRMQAEREIVDLNANLERRVAERTSELEQANQELESFSYSVSHDLRAPLRAIDGWAQVLEEDHVSALDNDARSAVRRMRSAAQRMGTLMDDLLTLSRVNREPIKRDVIEVHALVERIWSDYQESEPGELPELLLDELPDCRGAPNLIRQVWINLIGNAVKFSRGTDLPRIHIGSQINEGGEQVYFIRDNGVGFDMQFASKLFGAFQRLHDPQKFPGTGIGLALCQRILRRHGGQIWAEGRAGEGATFFFTTQPAQKSDLTSESSTSIASGHEAITAG